MVRKVRNNPKSKEVLNSALELLNHKTCEFSSLSSGSQELLKAILLLNDTSKMIDESDKNSSGMTKYLSSLNKPHTWQQISKMFRNDAWTATSQNVLHTLIKQIQEGDVRADEIIFVTGLGIDKSAKAPIRLPAVLIPTLSTLSKIKQVTGQVPQFVIYQTTSFIAETNSIDLSAAHTTAIQMRSYLRRYVDVFHPDIADAVKLLFGMEIDQCKLDSIRGQLTEMAKDRDSKVKPLLETLRQCEKRHSNSTRQLHVSYGAANVLFNGGVPSLWPLQEIVGNVKWIIMVGGPCERSFFKLTEFIRATSSTGPSLCSFITAIGAKPTYYIENVEPTLNDVEPLTNWAPSTHTQKDWDALVFDTHREFASLVEELRALI